MPVNRIRAPPPISESLISRPDGVFVRVDVVVEVVETGGTSRTGTKDVAGPRSIDVDIRATEVAG